MPAGVIPVERHFARCAGLRLHWRECGDPAHPPLVLLHPSPSSSALFEPWMRALQPHWRVLAPDTPGYGASDPLAAPPAELADYLPALLAWARAVCGATPLTLYGSATGAQLAIAWALREPQLVRHLVLDNAAHFEPEERQALLQRYFPDLGPQADGAHMGAAWRMATQMLQFFPWFADDEAHRVGPPDPPAARVHALAVELLAAGPHWAAAYRAAFAHEDARHVQALRVPTTLLRWAGSIIGRHVDALLAHELPAHVRVRHTPAAPHERYAEMTRVLRELQQPPAPGTPVAPVAPIEPDPPDPAAPSAAITGGSLLTPRVCLLRLPEGTPQESDFALESFRLQPPAGGQVLVRVLALSLDPYLRSAMAGRHLGAPILPGQAMRSEALVEVLRSEHPRMAAGQRWVATCGWQQLAVLEAAEVELARRVPDGLDPPTLALGVMGMPGLTAWVGVRLMADLQPGQTFLVSAASGPVGATAGQLARLAGCRVVGIAGGPHKCDWVRQAAGFAACIDHRQGDLREALRANCPDGIDVYFDNVGGDVLQAACEQLAAGARVVLCGLVSQYGQPAPAGPNPAWFIRSRATVRGLVVYDHWDRLGPAQQEIGAALRGGRLVAREDRSTGLAHAAQAFCRLMRGENQGKSLVLP